MLDLWITIAPLAIASAVVPVQLVVTVLLLKRSWAIAAAWVAGLATVRLLQGALFGAVLGASEPGAVQGGMPLLALTVGVLLLGMAVRSMVKGAPPEDAPPPAWTEKLDSMTPLRAFGAGALVLTIAVKFWAFTLAAASAIASEGMTTGASTATYLAWTVLALSTQLALLAVGASRSPGAKAALEGFSAWIEGNTRVLGIVVGLVFGAWFIFKGLQGLGVL